MPVHLSTFSFIEKNLNTLGNASGPTGYHSDWSDACVACFPGCDSCAYAKAKYVSLRGMNVLTPLKMITMYTVIAFFCCLNPFSISEHCFQFLTSIRSLCPESVSLFQFPNWFLLGSSIQSERTNCCWLRSTFVRCQTDLHQNPICLMHLRDMCCSAMYLFSKSKPLRASAALLLWLMLFLCLSGLSVG